MTHSYRRLPIQAPKRHIYRRGRRGVLLNSSLHFSAPSAAFAFPLRLRGKCSLLSLSVAPVIARIGLSVVFGHRGRNRTPQSVLALFTGCDATSKRSKEAKHFVLEKWPSLVHAERIERTLGEHA